MSALTIGLPNQHKEPGEKRAFLPGFVAWLEKNGFQVVMEHGYGAGMGYQPGDYLRLAPNARFAAQEECYAQDHVLVLRFPNDEVFDWIRPGACLISMCHYPTRPGRVEFLRALGLEALSLDSLKDDSGRRLVENLRAVAWNGAEVAFRLLAQLYPPPGFTSPQRLPISVTLLGAGAVGSLAVGAAVHYGDEKLRARLAAAGVPGVQVGVFDYDLTSQSRQMQEVLFRTDLLIDATQRRDPSQPVIPNGWLAYMPEYAVLLDLSVDPYDCPAFVKGIEGIPQGSLDQYIFAPDDPAYARLPECIGAKYRRHVVSCYSWPGLHPQECMHLYGRQLQPVMRKLAEKGGLAHFEAKTNVRIDPEGTFFERAIGRAMLSRWPAAAETSF